MGRVGVRELKQNASAVIERVRKGEVVDVTVRGEPVARLTPIRKDESVLDQLIARGEATPATKSIDDLPPPLKRPPGSRPLSEILDEDRADRI